MKVRRKINEIDVERAIKKILAEQGITRKCLNYLAANVDELQADYITSIMGKMFQSTRPVRGATVIYKSCRYTDGFQSTRPVRGAT